MRLGNLGRTGSSGGREAREDGKLGRTGGSGGHPLLPPIRASSPTGIDGTGRRQRREDQHEGLAWQALCGCMLGACCPFGLQRPSSRVLRPRRPRDGRPGGRPSSLFRCSRRRRGVVACCRQSQSAFALPALFSLLRSIALRCLALPSAMSCPPFRSVPFVTTGERGRMPCAGRCRLV
jgi:hypothetical protein